MVNILLIFIIMGCNKQTSFHQDIKPIIHKNCAVCHHNKGSGPFNLLTYKDVSKRANMILEVVETQYMPPWPADPNYREFLNQKVLHKEEIMLIKKCCLLYTSDAADE